MVKTYSEYAGINTKINKRFFIKVCCNPANKDYSKITG